MKKIILSGALAVAVIGGVGAAVAGDEAAIEIKASTGLRDLIASAKGKRVALVLESGTEVEGTVEVVGRDIVHLSRLVGKDFYDAGVAIDKVAAVRFRARDK